MQRDKELSARLKSIREGLQLKQKEFADQLGISQGYLSELENGSKQPSDTLLLLLSNLFAINMEWLATGEGEADSSMVRETGAHYTGKAGRTTTWQKDKKRSQDKTPKMPKDAIKSWIDELWAKASDKERAWFEIEFERAFPEFKEWLVKRDDKGSVTRKKILRPDSRG